MSSDINKSNDEINISFSISRGFISSQIAIGLGCFALWIFSGSQAIKTLLILGIALDVMAIILYLVSKGKDAVTSESKDEQSTERESIDVEVVHSSSNNSAVRETQGTIRNKVPVPNPTVTNDGFAQPEPEVQQTIQEEPKPVNLNEDISDDWSEFY